MKLLRIYKLIITIGLIGQYPLLSSVNNQQDMVTILHEHITALRKADAYWAHVQRTPYRHILNNFSLFGFQSWNNAIQKKRDGIKQLLDHSASMLGQLTHPHKAFHKYPEIMHAQIAKNNHDLSTFSIPSHMVRKWPLYVGFFVLSAYGYYMCQNITQADIEQKWHELYTQHIDEPYNDIKNFKKNLSALRQQIASNHALFKENIAYFLPEIEAHPEIKNYLQSEGVDFDILQEISISSNTALAQTSRAQKEIDHIFTLIERKLLTSLQASPQDPAYLPYTQELQQAHQSINESMENITQDYDPKNPPVFARLFGPLCASLLGGKENLKQTTKNIFTFSQSVSDITHKINLILSTNNADRLLPFVKIWSQCFIFKTQYFELMGLEGAYKAQFPIIIAGSLPATLACYALYYSTKKAWHFLTEKHIAKPFRMDLLNFQLHLNRYKTTPIAELPDVYYGFTAYWTEQIAQYATALPEKYQDLFEQALSDLRSSFLDPQQKLHIIETLCDEFESLE